MGLSPYVERVVMEAEKNNASAVILDINTHGGRVDAAVLIRDLLIKTKLKTVAFINRRAISAGALIALACETIAIAPGGSIGAATPIKISQSGEAKDTSEKMVSYMRKEFAATAEKNNRPKKIAEAMVDNDVIIEGLISKGKLLTMTQKEAIKWKVADFACEDIKDLLTKISLSGSRQLKPPINWAEKIARFVTDPMVSSLLVTLGSLGLIVEFYTPGLGMGGISGLICLGLFFWGHSIAKLAGFEEIILFMIGVVLLGLEVFVIPGFGIAGILGIISMSAGVVLSMLGTNIALPVLSDTIYRLSLSLILTTVIFVIILRFLPKRRIKTFVLRSASPDDAPHTDISIGDTGVTKTTLRPAGKAYFGDFSSNVISDGEYIAKGTNVKVAQVEGNKVVVKKI